MLIGDTAAQMSHRGAEGVYKTTKTTCPEPLARREPFLNARFMSIEWIMEKSRADHRLVVKKTSGNFTLSPFTWIYGCPLLLSSDTQLALDLFNVLPLRDGTFPVVHRRALLEVIDHLELSRIIHRPRPDACLASAAHYSPNA